MQHWIPKKPYLAIVTACFFLCAITACSQSPEPEMQQSAETEKMSSIPKNKIPVIFDTDMAIDDWAALLFLQGYKGIDFRALTIAGSGESHCEPGMKNALALLDLSAPDTAVPVACGDPWPLEGYFVFPVPWQEDMDRLSGVPVPPSQRQVYDGHAVELIHETLVASEEPMVILATGPLTNIAQWLEKYPEDTAKVSRLVIMGGALDAPGNIIVPGFTDDNPNTKAEWNFYVDPVAADLVLRSSLSIELVGLDVTNQVLVTSEFADYFKSVVDSPAAEFWDAVLDANDWFIDSNEYYFWDVLAALVITDKETFCQSESAALRADWKEAEEPWLPTSDMTIPDTNNWGEPRKHLDAASAGVVVMRDSEVKNTEICRTTNAKKAFDDFVAALTFAEDLPPQPVYKTWDDVHGHLHQKDEQSHMQHPYVFHLVQTDLWQTAVEKGETYYPPTYEQDGFTHATANPEFLLTIGNHFYKDVSGQWGLLKMTVDSLAATGVETIFEGTAPVGDKQPDFEGSDEELFPHILGGISPDAVIEMLAVVRDEQGEFIEIQGL